MKKINFNNINPIIILPWLLPALTIIYLKFQLMSSIGYRVVEKGIGREKLSSGIYNFTNIERLSFFSMDILLCLVAIPACFLLISNFINSKNTIKLVTTFSIIIFVIIFIQVQSQLIVGNPISLAMFIDSIKFSITEPDVALSYISLSAYIKFIFLFLITGGMAFLSNYLLVQDRNPNISKRILFKIVTAGITSIMLVSLAINLIIFNISPLPETNYHESLLKQHIKSFLGKNYDTFSMQAPTKEKFYSVFKQMTTPSLTTNNHKSDNDFGTQINSDLIVIIMETAPSRVSHIAKNNKNIVNMNRLLANSLFSNNHYSTFPFSNLAIFSIFTSWYPTGETLDLFMRYTPELPSFLQPLRATGYQTKLYIPCQHSFDFDELFFRKIGISSEFKACDAIEEKQKERKPRKLSEDRSAFNAMIDDIKISIKKDQRYAYVIAPQIGHGPWLDIAESNGSIEDKGKALIALQDKWIGELIDTLQNNNKLNDTVIVITGDHGIRTHSEDPIFPGNMIDEYSYRVPFILHAPRAKNMKNKELDFNTSHVDISPTLLHLFGYKPESHYPQGMNLNVPPYERAIFFNGKYYLAADGYFEGNTYYSTNTITGEVYTNTEKLHFTDDNLVLFNSTTSKKVQNKITKFYALQNAWQTYFFQNSPITSNKK